MIIFHILKKKNIVGCKDGGIHTGRKCKAGLNWAREAKKKNGTFFFLDDIDLAAVASKTDRFEFADGTKYKGYVGQEIRYLRRNWHHPQVRAMVKWWYKGQVTSAPWERDRDPWEPDVWRQYPQS
ncbi:hypothetical protein HED55_06980 [Ochrobactrum haematophilum]|uniref:Cytoplasmic protein n=1 Tax=Brucella haematophila TaxID=419474 RepID=A0ABX1DLI3_9HYPH|nr:hypothetical protein [Brucella haematophila]